MASTGWLLVTTGANNADAGNVAWSNPGNITADSTTVASAGMTSGQTSQWLHATAPSGISALIPAGSTIDGIEVRNRRYRSGSTHARTTSVMLIKAGSRVGSNLANTTTNWGTAAETIDTGGATELWGTTWTRDDVVASGFGFALMANKSAGSGTTTANIEAAWINVHFTEPSTGEDLVRVVGEGLGLTQGQGRARGLARLHSEATGIAETLVTEIAEAVTSFIAVSWAAVEATSVGGIVLVIDEAMEAGEQTLRFLGLNRPLLEPVGIGHASARVRGLNRIRADAVAVAEARLFARRLARVRAAALGLTEATGSIVEAIGQEIVRVLSGAVGLTEAAGRALSLTRRRAEAVGLTEMTARPRARTGLRSEPLEVSEAITQLRALVRLRSEVAAVSETTVAVLDDIVEAIVRIVSEAVAIPETSPVARALVRMHSETLAIAESVVRLGGVVAAVVPAIVRHRGRMETRPATRLETLPSARMSSRPPRRM